MTIFWCERCHASGAVSTDGAITDVVARIEEAHDLHELAQQAGCLFSVTQVRVMERAARVAVEHVATIIDERIALTLQQAATGQRALPARRKGKRKPKA